MVSTLEGSCREKVPEALQGMAAAEACPVGRETLQQTLTVAAGTLCKTSKEVLSTEEGTKGSSSISLP